MTCTFFGHRDSPEIIKAPLKEILVKLICFEGADEFFICNNGAFDRMALSVIRDLKLEYPHIDYSVVCAYLPMAGSDEVDDKIYPEGLELVPKRFAIDRRNRWMVEKSDCVVAYVLYSTGGAAKFVKLAKQMGKQVINIADLSSM